VNGKLEVNIKSEASHKLTFFNAVRSVPFNFLVVTYAVVQLFLHMTEQFLWGTSLSLFHMLVHLCPAVPLCCDVCLSDIKQGRSELLQLTAGYKH
jgi:hypothetical protein